MLKLRRTIAITALLLAGVAASPACAADTPRTEKLMLSGSGPDDAIPWDFRINGGMRAGQDTTIPVPSNWQQQGFGHYQYGYDRGPRSSDRAVYRRSFTVPADWKERTVRIVFDGVMTDASVRINGVSAGPMHQGGFNRFSYDVTKLLKSGSNVVEVDVAEASAAKDTDIAERHGDYWVFGGIYRPVWLEASPAQSIGHVAIDAKADGSIIADVDLAAPRTVTKVFAQILDKAGRPLGPPMTAAIPAGGGPHVRLSGRIDGPRLWSAETPNLYDLDVMLFAGDTPVHATRERFGFRTFEVREGKGLYLNGQRILLRGVNRHSFRPDTGRAISRADAYADVRTIRSLNMNAVRMSHYAPEKEFLEAADELGLYVIDELSGWQHAHGTEVGRKLVRSLVERDVNHPSVVIWANGNEGGWNRELDGDFALYDPQRRPVIHPWDPYGGIDTKHYPRYPDLLRRLNGPMLVLPTEFLHGLYDGGHGAGLDDYWKAISVSPRGAGGFLWNFADEGIARTDQGGRIDTYAAYAPDGLVGPRGEKEPSFDTVKSIWSPVQIATPQIDAAFDGSLSLTNGYDFTRLSDVSFRWEWLRFAGPDSRSTTPTVLASGTMVGPAIAPHASGQLRLPRIAAAANASALRLTATHGADQLWTWVWPTRSIDASPAVGKSLGTPQVARRGSAVRLSVGPVSASFDANTGLLTSFARGDVKQLVGDGARLVYARPADGAEAAWQTLTTSGDGVYALTTAMQANSARIDLGITETDGWAGFKLDVSADRRSWRTVFDGARVAKDGQTYGFPSQSVQAVRISKLAGVRATPRIVSVQLAGQPGRYQPIIAPNVQVRTGTAVDPQTGRPTAWLEAPGAGGLKDARWTLFADGRLSLDYRYSLDGKFLYHGVGFDAADMDDARVRALVRGPRPVWQNRIRGTETGVYDIAGAGSPNGPATRAGYFADPRWVKIENGSQPLTIRAEGVGFLQLAARLADFPTTTVEFPRGGLGFLNAIPGMGAKGHPANLTGPAGEPSVATGDYSGRLIFGF